jgi:hypothetical protein
MTEKLAFIQDQFSLNLSMLATVLRVSRPTLYAWLREEAEPHASNLLRIERLYSRARSWRRQSNAPLDRFGRRAFSSGNSIVGLLAEEPLDDARLNAAFSGVLEMVARDEKLGRGRETITARVRKQYGFRELTAADRARMLSDNTGI